MITEKISRSPTGTYVVAAIIVALLAVIGAAVLIPMQRQALAVRQAEVYFCSKPTPSDQERVVLLQYGDDVGVCGQAGIALRDSNANPSIVWRTDQGKYVDMAPVQWGETVPDAEGLVSFSAIPVSGQEFRPGDYMISIVVGHDATEVMRFRVEPQP